MNRSGLFWLAGGIGVAAIAFAAGYAAFFSGGPSYVVAFGEPIHQDDFTYSVVGVTREPSLSGGAARIHASGTFYIVTIQVENDARVVSFRWDPSMVKVIDAAGRQYQFSIDGQRAIDDAAGETAIVEHGESRRFKVAFDLPRDVERPSLAFSNGILMGDVFNGANYSKARIPLD